MENIEENNKLIAEFMGLELEETLSGKMVYARHELKNPNKENDCKTEFYEVSELLYHFSYDWLMPVVEKIQSLKSYGSNEADNVRMELRMALTYNHKELTKIQWVYNSVIEFIKWYNQQLKIS